MSANVISLNGGPTGLPERNENAVTTLKNLLEKAEAGEVVGVAIAAMHCDNSGGWSIGGFIGGYSLLGAIEVMKDDIMNLHRGDAT
jgi:hypothetical protein